jgi:hypothetical protein
MLVTLSRNISFLLHFVRYSLCVSYYTTVYPKVSGLAAWSENCKWYSSLPLCAVVPLFCVASQRVFIIVVVYFVTDSVRKLLDRSSCMNGRGGSSTSNYSCGLRYATAEQHLLCHVHARFRVAVEFWMVLYLSPVAADVLIWVGGIGLAIRHI